MHFAGLLRRCESPGGILGRGSRAGWEIKIITVCSAVINLPNVGVMAAARTSAEGEGTPSKTGAG